MKRMKRRVLSACLLSLCLFGSGCAGLGKYDGGYYYPCKAMSTDVGCIVLSVKYAIAGWPEDHRPDAFDFLLTPPFIPFLMIDLVFSFISDFITFPYDLCHAGEKIPERTHEVKESEDEPERKPAPGPEEKKPDEPQGPK